MSRWNDLTMAQKSELIGVAVRNGITGLEEIRSIYEGGSSNSSHQYRGGGLLTNAELLSKVESLGHKAHVDKNGQLVTEAGSPLIYNYDKDRFEFRNSAGKALWLDNNGKFKTYTKKYSNEEEQLSKFLKYPALYQTILEDEAFVRNRRNINDEKAIPFIEDKEHIIKNGNSKNVSISTNLVDSVENNLPNNRHQEIILGIGNRETNMGNYSSYSIKTPGTEDKSLFKESGKVSPTDLTNNHQYYISPMRGELNAIYGMKGNIPIVYGHPEAFYSPESYIAGDGIEEIEHHIRGQRKAGKFDPLKKREGTNYYNPEDNPWKHAVDYFLDKNYGMGEQYADKVNKEIPSIKYLLNINKLGGYLYQKGGGLKGGKRAGDKAGTDQCAAWSNGLLRDNGYLISGNAWGLNHVDMLFNGFDGLDKPNSYDRNLVETYNHRAAENVYHNFDSKTLDKSRPYVVNMYYNGSPALEEAYNNGKGVSGTHTGILTHDGNQWVVTHNIHDKIHEEPFIQLQNGANKYGVTAVYEPRENNVWNKLKGLFGFSDGGFFN